MSRARASSAPASAARRFRSSRSAAQRPSRVPSARRCAAALLPSAMSCTSDSMAPRRGPPPRRRGCVCPTGCRGARSRAVGAGRRRVGCTTAARSGGAWAPAGTRGGAGEGAGVMQAAIRGPLGARVVPPPRAGAGYSHRCCHASAPPPARMRTSCPAAAAAGWIAARARRAVAGPTTTRPRTHIPPPPCGGSRSRSQLQAAPDTAVCAARRLHASRPSSSLSVRLGVVRNSCR
jgi:hypothetical protein